MGEPIKDRDSRLAISNEIPRFGDHLYSAGAVDLHAVLVLMPNGASGSLNHTEPSVTYVESGLVWLVMDGFAGWVPAGGLIMLPAGVRTFIADVHTRGISLGLGSDSLSGRHAVQPSLVMLDRRGRADWLERACAMLERPLSDRTELCRRIDELLTDEVETRERKRRELVAQILSTLESDTSRTFLLSELGDRFGYAPNHLNEIVSLCTGRSIRKWEIGFRLEAARRLLKQPHLAVSEVASQVGMDAAYFSRLFRARYRLAPSAWRESVFGGTNLEPLVETVRAGGVLDMVRSAEAARS